MNHPLTRRVLASGLAAALAAGPALARPRAAPPAGWADGLDAWLEAQRVAWGAPGLAVALIRDGAVVWLKGYGVADVTTGAPVTADTLFRGASTTKALAAASVAALVDEGTLSWDEPVTRWVPALRTSGGQEWASLSLRDMLSHRTGLPRHDLVWYGAEGLTRGDLLARLPGLAMSAPLRARYQYNNIMYALAGHVAETAAGAPWEALARARIFEPVGMTRACLSVAEMRAAGDHAVGHRSDAAGRISPVPLRQDGALGPAGALNASVRDYARWAQMQLGRGVIDGRRVLSLKAMAAMWEPLILAGPTPAEPQFERAFYGLGWRIDRYRDLVRVAHGGDLNGFTSRVVLLPQAGVGLALLVNHGGHPLPNALTGDLLDRLLARPPEGQATAALARRQAAAPAPPAASEPPAPPPVRPLAAYAGAYSDAGYGAVTVTATGDGLSARYNDMRAVLVPAGPDAFRTVVDQPQHDDFGGLSLRFAADPAGAVTAFAAVMEEAAPPVTFRRNGV